MSEEGEKLLLKAAAAAAVADYGGAYRLCSFQSPWRRFPQEHLYIRNKVLTFAFVSKIITNIET
jgi:hypothetical protein